MTNKEFNKVVNKFYDVLTLKEYAILKAYQEQKVLLYLELEDTYIVARDIWYNKLVERKIEK